MKQQDNNMSDVDGEEMFNLYVESLAIKSTAVETNTQSSNPVIEEAVSEFFKDMSMKELVSKILTKLPDPTPQQKNLIMGLFATSAAYAIGKGARQFYEFLTGHMPEDNFFQWLSEFLK